jgi:hypothetical protein
VAATSERLDYGVAGDPSAKPSAIEYDSGMPMMIRNAGIYSV